MSQKGKLRHILLNQFIFRSDNFESSLATLVQLGTSALKVGMSAVGEAGPGQQFASKGGGANPFFDCALAPGSATWGS